MIIKPKVRGFVCVTAHPAGCAAHVAEWIRYVRSKGPIANGPRRVLVIGASTGYGLASRITAAFGSGAATLGIFYERPSEEGRTATPGWYNSIGFTNEARSAGLYAGNINGDAFSAEIKAQALEAIRKNMGQVDLVIYSLASPRRAHPTTGAVHKSVLKPVGAPYTNKTVDTDKGIVSTVTIEPASEQEIADTVAVMGGEDWEMWMSALSDAGLLAPGAQSVAYSYIGPEVTWAIYKNGTIGLAKNDLERAAKQHRLAPQAQRRRQRVHLGEQGARDPGEFRDPRRPALHLHSLQGDEGPGDPRGLHRADAAPFRDAAVLPGRPGPRRRRDESGWTTLR